MYLCYVVLAPNIVSTTLPVNTSTLLYKTTIAVVAQKMLNYSTITISEQYNANRGSYLGPDLSTRAKKGPAKYDATVHLTRPD